MVVVVVVGAAGRGVERGNAVEIEDKIFPVAHRGGVMLVAGQSHCKRKKQREGLRKRTSLGGIPRGDTGDSTRRSAARGSRRTPVGPSRARGAGCDRRGSLRSKQGCDSQLLGHFPFDLKGHRLNCDLGPLVCQRNVYFRVRACRVRVCFTDRECPTVLSPRLSQAHQRHRETSDLSGFALVSHSPRHPLGPAGHPRAGSGPAVREGRCCEWGMVLRDGARRRLLCSVGVKLGWRGHVKLDRRVTYVHKVK